MIQNSLARLCGLVRIGSQSDRRRRNRAVNRPEQLEERQMLAATALQAFHRSGQTFITWNEDTAVTGEKYNVYRSVSPITAANIGAAEKLTRGTPNVLGGVAVELHDPDAERVQGALELLVQAHARHR